MCTGNETRLYDCQHTGIGTHNCSHLEYAGVRCPCKQLCVCFSSTPFLSPLTYISLALCQDGDIRLRDGRNSTEGRVEICFNNQWGTVCDDSWDAADAAVVCTQLELPSEGMCASK